MLAKLELSIEKPDVLIKVREFLKSLGNDIKVDSVCGSVKLNIPVEPEELEEARAKKYVL